MVGQLLVALTHTRWRDQGRARWCPAPVLDLPSSEPLGTSAWGYLLVTWGLAEILTVWVWPVAVGVALMGGIGLRQVGVVLWRGAYILSTLSSRPSKEGQRTSSARPV